MRILTIGDCHITERTPSACVETYLEDLFDMLKWIAKYAHDNDVDAVVFSGDIFDRKIPSHNSHRLVHDTIEILSLFTCKVYIVPGNHDLQNDRFESLFATQPLGIVIRSGVAELLSGWAGIPTWSDHDLSFLPKRGTGPELPLYGIPWLQEWDEHDDELRRAAVDRSLYQMSRFDMGPTLIVTHAPFFPPGKESPYENYPTPDFAQSVCEVTHNDVSVYYGHIHEPHGVYSTNGVQFANAGALSRGALHEYNLHRKIQVMVWDSDANIFEVVDVPHKPAEEVFLLIEAMETKSNVQQFDAFMDSIEAATIEVTSIESIIHHVNKMDVEKEVKDTIENLLTEFS